jgi:hypothetical protein
MNETANSDPPLKRLQELYASLCDGEWEHGHGIHIGTLDNPGWSLSVNLADTYLSDRSFDEVSLNVNLADTYLSDCFDEVSVEGADENDWYICRVEDHVFRGACGPHRLCDIIALFLEWASKK